MEWFGRDLKNYLIHGQGRPPPSRPAVTVPRSPCALVQVLAGHKLGHFKGQHVLTSAQPGTALAVPSPQPMELGEFICLDLFSNPKPTLCGSLG